MTDLKKLQQCEKEMQSLLSSHDHFISNLSNFCALLKSNFDYLWVGFYLFEENHKHLYLGPFQGPLACTQIPIGKGVCGTSFAQNKTLNIANVHEFEGHIACSSLSNSELVIPLRKNKKTIGILDIDSTQLNYFSLLEEEYIEKYMLILESVI